MLFSRSFCAWAYNLLSFLSWSSLYHMGFVSLIFMIKVWLHIRVNIDAMMKKGTPRFKPTNAGSFNISKKAAMTGVMLNIIMQRRPIGNILVYTLFSSSCPWSAYWYLMYLIIKVEPTIAKTITQARSTQSMKCYPLMVSHATKVNTACKIIRKIRWPIMSAILVLIHR